RALDRGHDPYRPLDRWLGVMHRERSRHALVVPYGNRHPSQHDGGDVAAVGPDKDEPPRVDAALEDALPDRLETCVGVEAGHRQSPSVSSTRSHALRAAMSTGSHTGAYGGA